MTEPVLSRFIASVEDTARRILRLSSESMGITLRATANEPSLAWQVRNIRLPIETSRVAMGLTTTSIAKTLAPGTLAVANQDLRVNGSGQRWLSESASQITILERPHPREVLSGDMTFVDRGRNKLRLVVVDGLGHGPAAREAAQRTVQAFQGQLHLTVEEAVLKAHESAAATRGATLGVVDLDLETKLMRATTVGNIRIVMFFGPGRLWSPCGTDAVLGHGRGSFHGRLDVRVEQNLLPSDGLLAMFSDGLQNQLRLPWQRAVDPEELGLQLFSAYGVATDDATSPEAGG